MQDLSQKELRDSSLVRTEEGRLHNISSEIEKTSISIITNGWTGRLQMVDVEIKQGILRRRDAGHSQSMGKGVPVWL